MTKVVIVSDVHLKLRKHKDFEKSRFRRLIQLLARSDANVIIFNGDLLDYSIPTLEEIKELHDAFKALGDKIVYLLSGNHEAVNKDSSTYDYLSFSGVTRPEGGHSTINIDGVSISLCDWGNIHKLKDQRPADVLITHYRSAMEGLYGEEVQTADFINNYKLVILGDIHSRYSPLPHVFYTGSPYSIAATRKLSEDYGYIELTLDGGGYDWKYVDVKLPQKIRVDMEFTRLKDFNPDPQHLYNVHISGTLEDLKKIQSYDQVFFTKVVQLNAPTLPQIGKTDKTFIESLAEKVEEQVEVGKRHKVNSILLQIQGES